MNGIIGILVVIAAVACTYWAQRAQPPVRRIYSLLGGLASVVVAWHAAEYSQMGICMLFAASALVSLTLAITNYPKPTKR